jgi:hypothetical protein
MEAAYRAAIKKAAESEHKMEKVQTAAHLVTRAAEHGGPRFFAQMGMMQAIHRRHKREFNPDRKDPQETSVEQLRIVARLGGFRGLRLCPRRSGF